MVKSVQRGRIGRGLLPRSTWPWEDWLDVLWDRKQGSNRLLKKTRPLKLTLEHESDSCAVEKQQEGSMRGSDLRTGELFSYVDLEQRVPESHPLRLIRRIVNEVLAALDGEFGKLYAAEGRPSIAPERLLRALLLQAFYSIRSVSYITICSIAGLLVLAWMIEFGCRRCLRRTATGCSKPRWRANSWPCFSLIGKCEPCFRTTTFPSTARRSGMERR